MMIGDRAWRQKVAWELLFVKQLELGIFFLRIFGDNKRVRKIQDNLKSLSKNTIGHKLHKFLEDNHLNLVPGYENHDLKHVILGYGLSAPEEMKQQAFMFGNCGFSWIITPIYLSFVIWTPSAWSELLHHFKVGQCTKSIQFVTIESVQHIDLETYQFDIGLQNAKVAARMDKRSLWMVIRDEIKKRISKTSPVLASQKR